MAPNKPRKIASTKAKVAQNAPKESHKKRKVIDKNDEAESESGDTMGSAAELKENAVNTEIVSSGGSSDESVPVKKQSRKRKSQAVTKKPPKKKELEFDIKTKLASAISKHANLFDVNNSKYSDSRAENASWKDISKSIGVSIDDCMKHWASLKRSASNFTRPARIPFKSGAPGNELDDGDDKKYKDEWQFADVMNFHTPPALKKHEKLISARNPSTSTENDGESDAFWHNEANTMDSFEIEDANNVYNDIASKPKQKSKQTDSVPESIASMANNFSSYLNSKTAVVTEQKPQLKHFTMWAHFDNMVAKLDDDSIEDLNLDITILIGEAIKAQRQKSVKEH